MHVLKKLIYRHEGTFGDDGNVLKLSCGDGCTSLQKKNHWIVHLKIGKFCGI